MRFLKLCILLVALQFLFIQKSWAGGKKYHCSWFSMPFTDTVVNTCWQGSYEYDQSSGVYYSLANNQNFLFITVKTSREDIKRLIISGGLIVELEGYKKHGADFYLHFPMPTGQFNHQEGLHRTVPESGKKNAEDHEAKVPATEFNLHFASGFSVLEYGSLVNAEERYINTTNKVDSPQCSLIMDENGYLYFQTLISLDQIFEDNINNHFIDGPVLTCLLKADRLKMPPGEGKIKGDKLPGNMPDKREPPQGQGRLGERNQKPSDDSHTSSESLKLNIGKVIFSLE